MAGTPAVIWFAVNPPRLYVRSFDRHACGHKQLHFGTVPPSRSSCQPARLRPVGLQSVPLCLLCFIMTGTPAVTGETFLVNLLLLQSCFMWLSPVCRPARLRSAVISAFAYWCGQTHLASVFNRALDSPPRLRFFRMLSCVVARRALLSGGAVVSVSRRGQLPFRQPAVVAGVHAARGWLYEPLLVGLPFCSRLYYGSPAVAEGRSASGLAYRLTGGRCPVHRPLYPPNEPRSRLPTGTLAVCPN